MKRARVIYNPSSGREEAKRSLADILKTFEKLGYETSAHATTGKGDATREASKACESHIDLIVSVGGDGTVYEVINGISEKEYRPKLAILPLGTTNDFARALGIPRGFHNALKHMRHAELKMVDVCKMNKRYFINVAGGGTLTELTYEVPSKLKTALGQLAYYIKGAEKMVKFRPFPVELTVDGNVIQEEILLFLVANSNSIGGLDKIVPNAKYNDGLLDILVLKKSNLAEMGRVATALLKGEHLNEANILYFQASEFSIVTSENIQINLDGELGGMSPCNFKVLNHHIEVLC